MLVVLDVAGAEMNVGAPVAARLDFARNATVLRVHLELAACAADEAIRQSATMFIFRKVDITNASW